MKLIADRAPGDGDAKTRIDLRIASKVATGGLSAVELQNPWGAGVDTDAMGGAGSDVILQVINENSDKCWGINVGANDPGVNPATTRNVGGSSAKPRFLAKTRYP